MLFPVFSGFLLSHGKDWKHQDRDLRYGMWYSLKLPSTCLDCACYPTGWFSSYTVVVYKTSKIISVKKDTDKGSVSKDISQLKN